MTVSSPNPWITKEFSTIILNSLSGNLKISIFVVSFSGDWSYSFDGTMFSYLFIFLVILGFGHLKNSHLS